MHTKNIPVSHDSRFGTISEGKLLWLQLEAQSWLATNQSALHTEGENKHGLDAAINEDLVKSFGPKRAAEIRSRRKTALTPPPEPFTVSRVITRLDGTQSIQLAKGSGTAPVDQMLAEGALKLSITKSGPSVVVLYSELIKRFLPSFEDFLLDAREKIEKPLVKRAEIRKKNLAREEAEALRTANAFVSNVQEMPEATRNAKLSNSNYARQYAVHLDVIGKVKKKSEAVRSAALLKSSYARKLQAPAAKPAAKKAPAKRSSLPTPNSAQKVGVQATAPSKASSPKPTKQLGQISWIPGVGFKRNS